MAMNLEKENTARLGCICLLHKCHLLQDKLKTSLKTCFYHNANWNSQLFSHALLADTFPETQHFCGTKLETLNLKLNTQLSVALSKRCFLNTDTS